MSAAPPLTPSPAKLPGRRHPWQRWAATIALALAVAYQLVNLAPGVFRQAPRLFGDLGQPAVWRGAINSQGSRFAQFIVFLHNNIPLDASVVLPPPTAGSKAIANTPLMQFFLLPRRVINCTDFECIQNFSLVNSYVLVVNDFPGAEILSRGKNLRFNNEWGLFVLPGNEGPKPPALTGYTSGLQILRDILLPALWLAALSLAGYVLVALLQPAWRNPAGLALGFGLSMAALSFILCLLSLLGLPLNRGFVAGVTLFLLALALAGLWQYATASAAQRALAGQPGAPPSLVRPALRIDLWQAFYLLLGMFAALYAIGAGYAATDEVVLWGSKGYGLAVTNDVRTVTQFGTNTVPYPLHIPLSIAAARLLFGEALPASKLIFPAYYTALALLIDHLLRQLGVRRTLAGLATLLVCTAPLVFRHGALAYANLPLAFYILAAVGLLAQAVASPTRAPDRQPPAAGYALSGLFFAAAAWTRPEGLLIAWLLAGILPAAAYLLDRQALRGRQLACLLAPLLIYSLFWAWLKAVAYAQPLGRSALTGEALRRIITGDLHLKEALYILRALLATTAGPDAWGLLGLLALLLALVALARLAWVLIARPPAADLPGSSSTSKASLLIVLASLGYFAAVMGMYYLTSFSANRDLSWWVKTGLERMWLPGLLLLWVGGIGTAQVFNYQQDRPSTTHLE
jgi:hypothetical protein